MSKQLKTEEDFSAGGLVWDARAKMILMVQVKNLSGEIVWTFPKGHPEKRESDQEAAAREVLEETGWVCQVEKHLQDVTYYYVKDKTRYHKTVRWFVMSPSRKEGDFDPDEILGCEWVKLDEARKRVKYISDKDILRSFQESR